MTNDKADGNSNLWDKLENESSKQYTAFCDYRDMGVGRSLDKLLDKYSIQTAYKPPTQRRETLASWSTNHNWVARVNAWDIYQVEERTKAHNAARTKIIEDELSDYDLQLQKWHDAYRRLPLHEVEHSRVDGDGNVTTFVRLNHDDFHRMTKWRDDIAKQGRRALQLPDRITEDRHTGKDGSDTIKLEIIRDGYDFDTDPDQA